MASLFELACRTISSNHNLMTEMLNSCIPKIITDYIVFYHIENCGILKIRYFDPCLLDDPVSPFLEFCDDCGQAAGLTSHYHIEVIDFMCPRFKVPKNLRCAICAVPLAKFSKSYCCDCKFYYKVIMSRRQRDNLKR
jgi:hypothetical protein